MKAAPTVVGPEPDRCVDTDPALVELRRQAREFIAELAAPVRRLRLRLGDAELEVEWDRPTGLDLPSRPADATAPAPRSPTDSAVAAPLPAPAPRISVRSPMVGTFYASANPDAPPFVKVGQKVKVGDTLGIIEAMKMFNQIEAEISGTVLAVLAESGHPVEFDEPLFVIG